MNLLWTISIAALVTFTCANPELQRQIDELQKQLDFVHRTLQDDGSGMDGEHNHNGMDGSGMDGGVDAANGGDHSGHSSSTVGHGVFFTTSENTIVLFEGWETTNYGEYIGTCLFVIFLGIFLEWLTTFRELYPRSFSSAGGYFGAATPNAAAAAAGDGHDAKPAGFSVQHLVKTILYMFGVTIAYFLMLIAMTFNVGLFISAVLGLTIGYFIFGPIRARCGSVKSTECCHNIA